jgi:type VI secretion system secreted protein Hcp
MPIYMNYPGIKGGVTAAGHEGWIELNSVQWGVSRTVSGPTSGSSGRESSAPSISEMVVTKPTDIASAGLLRAALIGEGQEVTIDFCKTDKGHLNVYLSYTLFNTLISSDSLTSKGDQPEESISLNFTKFECRDLLPGASPTTVGYDLATAKNF